MSEPTTRAAMLAQRNHTAIKPEPGPVAVPRRTTVDTYVVREGALVPFTLPDTTNGAAVAENGYVAPTAMAVVILPPSKHARRVALYPENSPTPWPLNSEVRIDPPAFTSAGLRILQGPYMPALIARALKLLQEQGMPKWAIGMLIGLSVSVVLNIVGVIAVVKFAKDLGVW